MPHVTLEAVWDVLKWVLLVLAAGFVGQFGRSLALKLIERRRRDRTGSDSDSSPHPLLEEMEESRLGTRAKIEKKTIKAKLKRAKKTGKRASRNDSG